MNELVKKNLYLTHMDSDELYHYGILGMHWGIRRFQPYPKGEKKGKEIVEAKTRLSNRAHENVGGSSEEATAAKKKRIKRTVIVGAAALTALVGAAALSHKVNAIRTADVNRQLNEVLSKNAADRVKLMDAREAVDKLYTRGRIEGWGDDETQKLFDRATEIRNHYAKIADESGRKAADLQERLSAKKGKRLKENVEFIAGKVTRQPKKTGGSARVDISEVERRFSESMKKQKLASKDSLISMYREAQAGGKDAKELLQYELNRRRNAGFTDIDMSTLADLVKKR